MIVGRLHNCTGEECGDPWDLEIFQLNPGGSNGVRGRGGWGGAALGEGSRGKEGHHFLFKLNLPNLISIFFSLFKKKKSKYE